MLRHHTNRTTFQNLQEKAFVFLFSFFANRDSLSNYLAKSSLKFVKNVSNFWGLGLPHVFLKNRCIYEGLVHLTRYFAILGTTKTKRCFLQQQNKTDPRSAIERWVDRIDNVQTR